MLRTAKAASIVLLLSTLAVVSVATAVGFRQPPSATAVIRPATVAVNNESGDEGNLLASRRLLIPVDGISRNQLRDNFAETRGGTRRHDALDIMAARGTPVFAVDDGRVAKLFHSAAGGLTIYQFDPHEQFAYYYAHLDSYAKGLVEGMMLKRGDVVGYVGSTGNAPANAPHLHFTIFRLGPDRKWWKGTAVNPYPYLTEAKR
jgi:murein DD-endopeptidase MepM/ murein hydrolase activator NlpD